MQETFKLHSVSQCYQSVSQCKSIKKAKNTVFCGTL